MRHEWSKRKGSRQDGCREGGGGLWAVGGGGVLLFKEVCLHKREEMGNKRL